MQGRVSWARGLPHGFGPLTEIASGASVDLRTADMDADGDADLIVGGMGQLRHLVNEGDGAFAIQPALYRIPSEDSGDTGASTTTSVHAVQIGDIDEDGDLDVLAAAGLWGHALNWFRNDGGTLDLVGSIGYPAHYPPGSALADLDGDGDLDVLSADAGDMGVSWFENLGGGAMGPERSLLTPRQPDSGYLVETADLDGDGDLDVIARFSYGFAWFRNDLCPAGGPSDTPTDTATLADTAAPSPTPGGSDPATSEDASPADGDGSTKEESRCGCAVPTDAGGALWLLAPWLVGRRRVARRSSQRWRG